MLFLFLFLFSIPPPLFYAPSRLYPAAIVLLWPGFLVSSEWGRLVFGLRDSFLGSFPWIWFLIRTLQSSVCLLKKTVSIRLEKSGGGVRAGCATVCVLGSPCGGVVSRFGCGQCFLCDLGLGLEMWGGRGGSICVQSTHVYMYAERRDKILD